MAHIIHRPSGMIEATARSVASRRFELRKLRSAAGRAHAKRLAPRWRVPELRFPYGGPLSTDGGARALLDGSASVPQLQRSLTTPAAFVEETGG